MIAKIKNFFVNKYFNEALALEHRMYMIFFFVSYIMVIFATITNTMLYSEFALVFPQWVYLAVLTAMLFLKSPIRSKVIVAHVLLNSFVYIPFIYFLTDGYKGTALLFTILSCFVLAVVFKGKLRVLVCGLYAAVCVACIALQAAVPGLVIMHSADEASIAVDYAISIVMCLVGITLLSTQYSTAYQKKNDALARIVILDPLTGIFNRRYLFERLERMVEDGSLYGSNSCLLVLDIDFFKQVNDTYGHAVGDKVLVALARSVPKMLREADIFARYGGEEFVVLLNEVCASTAMAVTERICNSIREMVFEEDLSITVSVGVTMARSDDTVESLFNRADALLYQAKANGRNCVVSSEK